MPIALFVIAILIPAAVIASFPLHAALSFRRARRARGPVPTARLVSVLVPFTGVEDGIARRVTRLLDQKTSFELDIIFCMARRVDPVVPVLERSIAGHARRGARLVVAGPPGGDLGKMRNLRAGVAAAHGDTLVFMDSDAEFDDEWFLQKFVTDLDRPGVGLVTCFPAYRNAGDVPSALIAMMINPDLVGYFTMLDAWGHLAVANGACMAISRGVLDSIGGLDPLRRQLLMDTKLAQRVAASGRRVHLHERPVAVVRPRMGWTEGWQQATRWQVSMWRVLPRWKYVMFVWLRCGGVLAMAALVASSFSAAGWIVVSAYFVTRVGSAWLLNARHVRNPAFARWVWLIPAVEVLNALTCVLAMFQTTVTWRGQRHRVSRDGSVREPLAGGAARRVARALRADEWGVQLVVLGFVAAIYYGTVVVDPRPYVVYASQVALWSAFMLAGAYLLNDYCDRRADSLKPFFRRDAATHPRRTLLTACLLTAAGVVLALCFAANAWVRLLVLAQLLAAVTYSQPPIRLKERGWLGVAAAAFFQRIPTFWMVALAFPVSLPGALALTGWLAAAGILFILEHQMEDLVADRVAGVRTLATTMGPTRLRRIARRVYLGYALVSLAAAVVIRGVGSPSGGIALAAGSVLLAILLRRRYAQPSRPELAELPAVEPEDVRCVAEHHAQRRGMT